ncbi:hypothetical protein OAC97_03970 [Flavobacteriaceae bacterium]|nr:hypothetical protein [Flavobacteriaceae bacterium]
MSKLDSLEKDKAHFKAYFGKNANDNLSEFLLFLNNKTNTMLNMKIGILTSQISELSDIILENKGS